MSRKGDREGEVSSRQEQKKEEEKTLLRTSYLAQPFRVSSFLKLLQLPLQMGQFVLFENIMVLYCKTMCYYLIHLLFDFSVLTVLCILIALIL